MMIIDAHTHVYPDRIAKAVEEASVRDVSDGAELFGSLSISGLIHSMQRNSINASIAFCLADRPGVVKAANDFIMAVCDKKRVFGLGTIHPDFEDYEAELNRLRRNGIKGIKWSSLFQKFVLDEKRMLRIYEAMGNDMIAYFHMGRGPGKFTDHVNSTPVRLATVLEMFPEMKVVAAHFGGLQMLAEGRQLIGKNLYLDTSWNPSLDELEPTIVADIIKEHGSNKILFATDYPFCDVKREISAVCRLPLNEEDKERILWKNANELFNLQITTSTTR